jgi:Ca2+:H+ antiporter
MEIGKQGAILTALLELPALVLMSNSLYRVKNATLFTLVFPMMSNHIVAVAQFNSDR